MVHKCVLFHDIMSKPGGSGDIDEILLSIVYKVKASNNANGSGSSNRHVTHEHAWAIIRLQGWWDAGCRISIAT